MSDATRGVQRLAAFAHGEVGGNPAGIVIADELPDASTMQRVAAEVGFSETAFAMPHGDRWRVRYWSPEAEVPFCGHATIALGAALAMRHGDGVFALDLRDAAITVEGRREGSGHAAALQSPPTRSDPVDTGSLDEALVLFGLARSDLDDRIPPAVVDAGARHLALMLKERATLAAMSYDFARGRALMRREDWGTVLLGHAHGPRRFSTRNAFAWGGVYEDPATGAASAALAGYLRDLGWPHDGSVAIDQGDDMGVPSRIRVDIPIERGSSVRVAGTVRTL